MRSERKALERGLCRTLYRFDCPSPDQLRDCHWGYLPADERQRIQVHLDTCPHCAAELADLAAFVAAEGEKPVSAWLARAWQAAAQIHLVVARLVSPGLSLVPALRGQTRGVLLFDAEGVALSVNVEQEETGRYTLFGQVLSSEPLLFPYGYARLTARAGDVAPVQAALDANGGFALSDLRPGIYQLVVCLPDRRIVVPALALKVEP